MLNRGLSILLRGLGLLSRLLLFISLGYFLVPEEVGRFGQTAATISFLVYILGADFYIITNRDLCVAEAAEKLGILKQSLPVFALTYLCTAGFLAWLFIHDFLPIELAFIIVIILIFEHLGQESYRILIALGHPVLASLSIFLRLGAWAIIISILMFIDERMRNLESVMAAWAIGNSLAAVVGLKVLSRLPRSGWQKPFAFRWIRAGLRISAPYLLATLCLRSLSTLDRFFVEYFTTAATVGAYVLYAGVGAAVPAFVDAALVSFATPKLLKFASTGDVKSFELEFRKLRNHCFLATTVLATGAAASIIVASYYFEHEIYREHIGMAILVLGAFMISTVSSVYNLELYAYRLDTDIIKSHFLGVVLFFAAIAVLAPIKGWLVVPLSLIVAQTGILASKLLSVRQRRKRTFN